MPEPRVTRPKFPAGYVDHPKGLVRWKDIELRLAEAKNYWLVTVRPGGRPHAVPKWGVWLDGRIYFDGSPETRHARNIVSNPHVVLHLESGDEPVIVEGVCRASPKPAPGLGQQLAEAYAAKYALFGYAPKPDQWDNGGLFEITPQTVLAWTKFTDDPTKFLFTSD